ncbi:MAG: stage II sporulation protein M [Candidatus Pacearchaeota archaeon]
MLEMLLNPIRSERRPWEMFFVGFIYAALSVILVNWVFGSDVVLVKYSAILIVTFTVMFCIPFFYYILRLEEEKEFEYDNSFKLIKEHGRAIHSLLWLFLGFVAAFSISYILIGSPDNFRAQIETYCAINNPSNMDGCVSQYGVNSSLTGSATSRYLFGSIFINNFYVLVFTLIFSIIFGAGGIFILAWNASVISAAVVIFSKSDIYNVPIGISRYLIHGIPEIAAYFIGTLAGGILGISLVKKEFRSEKFWRVLYDFLLLLVIAIVILFIAALIEVFVTPIIF